jgi:hypothetical protein
LRGAPSAGSRAAPDDADLLFRALIGTSQSLIRYILQGK